MTKFQPGEKVSWHGTGPWTVSKQNGSETLLTLSGTEGIVCKWVKTDEDLAPWTGDEFVVVGRFWCRVWDSLSSYPQCPGEPSGSHRLLGYVQPWHEHTWEKRWEPLRSEQGSPLGQCDRDPYARHESAAVHPGERSCTNWHPLAEQIPSARSAGSDSDRRR